MSAVAAVVAMISVGCSDVGDSSPACGVGGGEASVDSSLQSGDDAMGAPGDENATPGDDESAAGDDGALGNSGNGSSGSGSSSSSSGSSSSSSSGGGGVGGDGGSEATVEASGPDATVDATVSDGASLDAGPDGTMDAATNAMADGSGHDASEAGPTDAQGEGAAEAGADAKVDSGSLMPCTTAGQTNCVQCGGNLTGTGANGGLCSPTEALFVQHDIDKKLATAAGPDPSSTDPTTMPALGGCYACLSGAGCLDDTAFGDNGKECEAFAGGAADQSLCANVISCVLGASCAASSINVCYCGSAGLSTTCHGNPAPGPIDGKCATELSTANGIAIADGTDNQAALSKSAKPGGRAALIFSCALSNGCTQCLQ